MTRAEVRRLVVVIQALDEGNIEVARHELCTMARVHIPRGSALEWLKRGFSDPRTKRIVKSYQKQLDREVKISPRLREQIQQLNKNMAAKDHRYDAVPYITELAAFDQKVLDREARAQHALPKGLVWPDLRDVKVLTQPKPPKRIVNTMLLRAYGVSHPYCEVRGCGRPNPEVHHLVSRGKHGDDVDENLLALCWVHHQRESAEGWHHLGPEAWLKRNQACLDPRAVVKVLNAIAKLKAMKALWKQAKKEARV